MSWQKPALGKVDLLITHHPLIFKGLSSIDVATPIGGIIDMAIRHRMAIFCAHTNLDSVSGGVNDILAERIGLCDRHSLVEYKGDDLCKLVFFVPTDVEQEMLDAMFETPAGAIGNYSCCSFRQSGTGTFRPGASAVPFTGEVGAISHVDEIRIETTARQKDLDGIIDRLRNHHPYETMAYDIYPIIGGDPSQGLGRIGDLEKTLDLTTLARKIKADLGLGSIRMAGDPDRAVRRLALCTGSGAGLLNAFLASDADVYVSGDLKYHDARTVEAAGRAMLDIGHFASEHPVVEMLARRLEAKLAEMGGPIEIEACRIEKDPFYTR